MTYGIYIEGSGDMETTRIITSCSSIHMICMHIQIVHSNKAYMLRGGGGSTVLGKLEGKTDIRVQLFVYNYWACSHKMFTFDA